VADSVQFRIKNQSQVDAWLEKLSKIPGDTTPLMRKIGLQIQAGVDQTFRTQGARIGQAWPALRTSTVETDHGTLRLKYGTWKKPKRNWQQLIAYRAKLMSEGTWWPGKVGPLGEYKGQKRYKGTGDPPMQASGNFRKSFQILWLSKYRVRVGSTMGNKLASYITQGRPVMGITFEDRLLFRKLVIQHLRKFYQ